MALPVDVYLNVLSHLGMSDLAKVARCSRLQCDLVEPILYQTLSIKLFCGDPDASSTVLLRTLSTTPRLRYFIRQVQINNGPSTFWTSGHCKLLGLLLSSILTHPERIQSFTWRAGSLQTHIFFPEMVALECAKILTTTDMLWVRWHLLYCRSLESIRLNLSERVSQQASQWFLSQLSLQHLKTLSLRGGDLSTLSIDITQSLESLELNLCHNLESFLARLVSYGVPKSLRSLKIAGNIALEHLQGFLSAVASKVQLEELSLRIGGVRDLVSVKLIQALAPRLSTLVLDFRADLSDPRTSIKYTALEFQEMIIGFPLLKSIGIALDLRNPKCQRRYQRLKLMRDTAMKSAGLQHLHLRGYGVPLQRSVGDAKHLARHFAESRGLTVFLDHGLRLRKLNRSCEFLVATDDERSLLSTDLYGPYA